jgi:hypothetical protein
MGDHVRSTTRLNEQFATIIGDVDARETLVRVVQGRLIRSWLVPLMIGMVTVPVAWLTNATWLAVLLAVLLCCWWILRELATEVAGHLVVDYVRDRDARATRAIRKDIRAMRAEISAVTRSRSEGAAG